MSSFAEKELNDIIKKGWLMFDLKYGPKKRADVSIYNPRRDEYFNPESGWTQKIPVLENANTMVPNRINLIRKLILIDEDADSNCCYLYFFKSYLSGNSEMWFMSGLYSSKSSFSTSVSLDSWYSIKENSIVTTPREVVINEFILDNENEKIATFTDVPIEIRASNQDSFSQVQEVGLYMMLFAFNPYRKDYDLTKNRENMLYEINRIINEGTVVRCDRGTVSQFTWVIDAFYTRRRKWTIESFKKIYDNSFKKVLDDLVINQSKFYFKKEEVMTSEVLKEKDVLDLVLNHSDSIGLEEFAMLANLWKDGKTHPSLISILIKLNKSNPISFSTDLKRVYEAHIEGVLFDDIIRRMNKI